MNAYVLLDTVTPIVCLFYIATRIGLHVAKYQDKGVLSDGAKEVDVNGHVKGHVNVCVKV